MSNSPSTARLGAVPILPNTGLRMHARIISVVISQYHATDKKYVHREIFAGREIRITPDDDKSLSNSYAMDKYDAF